MTIPALRDAAGDPALRGTPHAVYLTLLYELDPGDYRVVKQAALASKLHLSDRAVRDALKVLVEHGYIVKKKGQPGPGGSSLYRLVYSRMPKVPLED